MLFQYLEARHTIFLRVFDQIKIKPVVISQHEQCIGMLPSDIIDGGFQPGVVLLGYVVHCSQAAQPIVVPWRRAWKLGQ